MKGVSDTACCFVRFLPSAFVHDVLVVPPPGWMCLPFPPDRQHNVVHRLSCRIANTRQLQMCWNMVVFAVRYARLAADKTTTRGHLTSMPTAHLWFRRQMTAAVVVVMLLCVHVAAVKLYFWSSRTVCSWKWRLVIHLYSCRRCQLSLKTANFTSVVYFSFVLAAWCYVICCQHKTS